jgi:alkanesulfonate monooxygenase SsuD/methylene tetrahydromethanopterin reductase-like flavin-dependent oxidoreductase (luciferase family)
MDENPMYMAEDAGAADLISGGRLQLGISRGSPEQVVFPFLRDIAEMTPAINDLLRGAAADAKLQTAAGDQPFAAWHQPRLPGAGH